MPGEAGGIEGKRLVRLWLDAVRLAAKHRNTSIVAQGSRVIRRLTWRIDVNREMVIAQADVDLLLAEACVQDLAKVPLLEDDGVDDEEGEAEEAKVDEAAAKAIEAEVRLAVLVAWCYVLHLSC